MSTSRRPQKFQGRIAVHPRGFGFVDLDPGEAPAESAFVAPPDLNPFLAGDLVTATLEASDGDRWQATGLELVERERDEVLGTVERRGRQGPELRLDPRIGNAAWPLHGAPKKLREGTTVVARPAAKKAEAHYLRAVGEGDAGRDAVLVIHRIRTGFDEDVLAETKRVQYPKKKRRDLRDVTTVTIDAAKSKDLDDALAVLPVQSDGAIRVLVSIADVDAGVRAGSRLDAEARRRGTSVYLPDLVVPMLPPALSEDALSLQPGVDRPALTVELRIDPEGEVTATDLSTSLIRSTARLNYVDVAAFLDRGDSAGVPGEVRETLLWLRTAAARLSAVRAGRGGLTIEPDEAELDLDSATGEPTSLDLRELTSAHLLIERLMVATNEAVAGWLIDRGLPALFRVLDEPAADQIERLAEFAANFGFRPGFGDSLSPRALAAFEEQIRTSSLAPSMRTVMRWLLGRARYQPTASPHYALAAPAYLHFTSPIRRYADLVVHRVVKAHLAGERETHLAVAELERIAAEVNDAARRAGKAEADRLRMLVARYFTQRIGEKHRGRIIAVKPFGLVVQLGELGVSGTVATEDLGKGPWKLDTATYSLVGPRRRFMVGEEVRARIASTDEQLGRLELELV